ncbi:MAG: choice-of-anchor Q domain-containing protein [Pyrinomonadaceae bacterium]
MKPTVPTLLIFLLCGVIVFCGAAVDARAAELTVTKTADTADGVCDGDCSLREAVIAAASGDTVVFSPLFNTPQTITLTLGQITIDKNLTITGTGQDLVTISGNNAGRIFYINGNFNITMSGMKLGDGKVGATSSGGAIGGAILIFGGSLNLAQMEFVNNTAFDMQTGNGEGAAIAGDECVMTMANVNAHHNNGPGTTIFAFPRLDITDSVVSDNTFGIVARTLNISNVNASRNSLIGVSGQFLTIRNSTITGNGRGVASGDSVSTMSVENSIISENTNVGLSNSGVATITNCVVTNNSRNDEGGGIANTGTLYIIDSTISGNTASLHGGAIRSSTVSHLYLTNSTISGNIAGTNLSSALGGGIYGKGNANVRFTNSTISNNRTSGNGGGFRADASGTSTITSTVIAANASTNTNEKDVSGAIVSTGINLIGDTFGSSGWIAGDLLNVNPMLGSLADNGGGTMTHALLPGSPAIDAGNNSLAVDPQTQMFLIDDQRGFPRRVGVLVDIGAYESTQTASPVIAGSVTYGLASPRFVPDVLVSGAGLPNVSATTLGAGPGQGTYLLTGFGSRSYSVTPTKTGGVGNGISSFDSGRIAQHVAAIITLTGNQFIVADVSGNGTLSSFDAGQIARYIAGLDNTGATANWIFIPVNRTYPSVTSNITGEDFIGLLMGDVSGNWMPGMSR